MFRFIFISKQEIEHLYSKNSGRRITKRKTLEVLLSAIRRTRCKYSHRQNVKPLKDTIIVAPPEYTVIGYYYYSLKLGPAIKNQLFPDMFEKEMVQLVLINAFVIENGERCIQSATVRANGRYTLNEQIPFEDVNDHLIYQWFKAALSINYLHAQTPNYHR